MEFKLKIIFLCFHPSSNHIGSVLTRMGGSDMRRVPGSMSWRATYPRPLPLTFTILNNLFANMVSLELLAIDKFEAEVSGVLKNLNACVLTFLTCPWRCPNTPFLRIHKLLERKKSGNISNHLLPHPSPARDCRWAAKHHQNSYIRPRSPLLTTL